MQLGRGLAEVLAALLTKILTEKAGIHRSEQYHMGMTPGDRRGMPADQGMLTSESLKG